MAVLLQIGIAARKRTGAEKAAVGGKRRRMRSAKQAVARSVNARGLFLGITAPEQKDQIFFVLRKAQNDLVGKCFPALSGVRSRFARFDAQNAVEQQHALLRPANELPIYLVLYLVL